MFKPPRRAGSARDACTGKNSYILIFPTWPFPCSISAPIMRILPLPLGHRLFVTLGLAALALSQATANAQNVVRVPADTNSIQDAINNVADGGRVEIAAGTYNAPDGAYTNPAGKAVTVQAAAGASVTISGGGIHDILRITNAQRASGKPMTFIGLTFTNGAMAQSFLGGVAILGQCEAIFRNCTFVNNSATGGPAAGALYIAASVVSLEGCTFSNNTSRNGGGAIYASDSRIYVTNCHFNGNRCDLPGHAGNAPGGAIFTFNSRLTISGSVFEDNHAGYVGGAVYGAAASNAATEVVDIKNTLFRANSAMKDPSVSFAAPAVGGAVHVEANVTLNIYSCNFTDNFSTQGGAISTDESVANVDHCFFQGNKALAVGTSGEGTGGAIFALAPGAATDPNGRAMTFQITDTIFLGPGDGSLAAKEGGQIFAGGGMQLTLTRVAFYKSGVDSSDSVPARGSAVYLDFSHLEGDNVLFLECDAGSGSGTVEAVNHCTVNLRHCSFQKNGATAFSAGITDFGDELNVSDSMFLDNFYKGSNSGKGIDLTSAPNRDPSPTGTDITGTISTCLFSGATTGGRIYDGAGTDKRPYNLLAYSANQFFPSTDAYVSDILSDTDVAGLNNFVVKFSDGSTFKKAPIDNVALTALPAAGQILGYRINAPVVGDPSGKVAEQNFVAFSATTSCSVDGSSQSSNDGMISVGPGSHTLSVGGQTFTAQADPNVALNISTRLQVGTGSNVLIGGFIIQGASPKRVAIRGLGPSLTQAGVNGALGDPVIEVHDPTGIVAQNDNWSTSDQRTDLAGFDLAPASGSEAALITSLNPGAYTVIVRGVGDTTGVGLVEVYDLDGSKQTRVANISTRGFVQGGDSVMIGGFIIDGGNGPTKLVVRGIGPSLPVSNALADPTLDLVNGQGTTIEINDDWGTGPHAADLQAVGLAPTNTAESAIYRTDLVRGAYTAILRAKSGGTGVGLVEVYVFQ